MAGDGARTNPLLIGCLRPGCRSKIIRAGAADLVQRRPAAGLPAFGADIAPAAVPESVAQLLDGAEQPLADGAAWFWRLGDMMDFENVGFSKPVNGLKFLSCADCDLAPIGFHDPASSPSEFLVAVDRVAYKP
ncbi:hypothetical protein H4R21_002598 [Coemansia helicoidea]|uniref:Uncharacterized protein n=1 Tax=Coemansia helicoidea TaxID=1286919 RepID=A0ACC1L780_9FUNG|nr:hypothetical protein H4R21_002598 [Coemansia helicoidea]